MDRGTIYKPIKESKSDGLLRPTIPINRGKMSIFGL